MLKKTFGAIPIDSSSHDEVTEILENDEIDFETPVKGESKQKNDQNKSAHHCTNEDTYENFLFTDIAVGLLAIYHNLIESLHTNKFKINESTTNKNKTLTGNQTTTWYAETTVSE